MGCSASPCPHPKSRHQGLDFDWVCRTCDETPSDSGLAWDWNSLRGTPLLLVWTPSRDIKAKNLGLNPGVQHLRLLWDTNYQEAEVQLKETSSHRTLRETSRKELRLVKQGTRGSLLSRIHTRIWEVLALPTSSSTPRLMFYCP